MTINTQPSSETHLPAITIDSQLFSPSPRRVYTTLGEIRGSDRTRYVNNKTATIMPALGQDSPTLELHHSSAFGFSFDVAFPASQTPGRFWTKNLELDQETINRLFPDISGNSHLNQPVKITDTETGKCTVVLIKHTDLDKVMGIPQTVTADVRFFDMNQTT